MDCNFIKSLTPEQRKDLRERLDECEAEQPKYSVRFDLWDNGKIRRLAEYLGDQKHGFSLGWFPDGQPVWKREYQNGNLIKDLLRE